MKKIENPVFGRKVFFVQPSFTVEKFLIEYLKKSEYEVYVIEDISRIKNLLAANPDSLCFFDIDTEWSYAKWFSYLKSFSENQTLSSIYFGVISEKAGWEEKDKFIVNLNIPAGFTIIDRKSDALLKNFVNILDYFGAKGRRKYLRLDTRNLRDVNGYMTYGSKLFTFEIKDISSAGFAITYKQDLMQLFQKNTHIKNLCVSIGHKSLVCSCIVFNTQPNNDGTAMSVLMLTNENPASSKEYIRDYVFSKNATQMKDLLLQKEKDSERYTDSEEYLSFRAVRNRNYEELDIIHGADSI